MELNSKSKPSPNLSTWEFQRLEYVQTTSSLNSEFAHFKQFGAIAAPSDEVVVYTLPAHAESEEVIHVPHGYRCLQVSSGKAWISYKGRDHLLKAGDELCFDRHSEEAVISSTGKAPLTFLISA